MDLEQALPTSSLLRALKVSYPTFIKWRQQDLIPEPLAARPGRGRGLGRVEARWPQAVFEQADLVCQLRQKGLRFDEIAIDLWLSGHKMPVERVRNALINEWERFLGLFETQVFPLRQKLERQEASEQSVLGRLARKIARRRPGFPTLPPREQRATVAAWRQIIAPMVFGADQPAEMQDGKRLVLTIGLHEDFGTLMHESHDARWLRGALKEKALADVLKDPAMAADLLARVLPQARFIRFVAELPESLTSGPTDWARALRMMKGAASIGPRSFWIGMLLIKMARGGLQLGDVVTTVEELAMVISQSSPLLAAQLISAAQSIIPEVASLKKRR